MKVLVAYASRHGATKGIAERIAETLTGNGLETTLEPANGIADVREYDAFVVGAAAYAFHWLEGATKFVRHNKAVLANHPTWLFSSGPLGDYEIDPKTGKDQRITTIPREFAEFTAEIKPRDEHIFFGAWDTNAPAVGLMERFMKVMPAKDALPAGDFRDWAEIEAWAAQIASELRTAN
jgi:menaquinone-dependent protoporphyrinogen oxidase